MNAWLRLRSDRQLLALMRSGSDEAFAVLHDRYRPRLFLYVRRILHRCPPEDAEDVLQDVFARSYRSLLADEREIPVSAWLYRIARNRCLDHIRGRPEPALPEDLPARDAFEELLRREDVRRLLAVKSLLSRARIGLAASMA